MDFHDIIYGLKKKHKRIIYVANAAGSILVEQNTIFPVCLPLYFFPKNEACKS